MTADGDDRAETLDTWAIVEAMGHRTAIGRVSEATIAGKPLLKVDRLDGVTQYYPPESLYCLTPCTEDQARNTSARTVGNGLPYALAALSAGDGRTASAWAEDADDEDPYTEAGRDYQRAEMAREDARDPHAGCGHDDEDDLEVVAPGDQDHDWPGPKGPF